MNSAHLRTLAAILYAACVCCTFGEPNDVRPDWDSLWKVRQMQPMPEPKPCQITQTGTLGEDLARNWQTVPTKYHMLHFTKQIEPQKLKKVYVLIDNIYEFLQQRAPEASKPAQTPIAVFLVDGQLKRSRCCPSINAMRTGDQGDIYEIITSLLHEETHLFNMVNLDGKPQGWWLGEFSCQYFQIRAGLSAAKTDIRRYVRRRLPNGPKFKLHELDEAGKDAFDEAFAALYFLEERYGHDSLRRFRALHLDAAKSGERRKNSSFMVEAYGEDVSLMEQNWLAFYGWKTSSPKTESLQTDKQLDRRVTYSADKQSLQSVVRALAEQAQLRYNQGKSLQQADVACRQWVYDIKIQDQPLDNALKDLLEPAGLTFVVEEDAIVLYKQ